MYNKYHKGKIFYCMIDSKICQKMTADILKLQIQEEYLWHCVKHEVLEELQDYEIEAGETPRYNPIPKGGLSAAAGGAAP